MSPQIKLSSEKRKKTKQKNGIVTAVVVTHSDFSQLLNLQNLLNYLIECLTYLFSKIEFPENILLTLKLCLEHTKRLKPSKLQCRDEELKKMIENFIEEVNTFYPEIENVKMEEMNKNLSLYGKTSKLQWLAVCLHEEIKRYLFRSDVTVI